MSKKEKSQQSNTYKQKPEEIQNIFSKFINTEDADEEIRRSYTIQKKHLNMLDTMKMLDGREKNYSDLIREAIEMLWK